MSSIAKSYWCSRYIFLLSILGIGFSKTYSQNTFFYECEALRAMDVFEDSKGCIIATTDDRVIRLSPNGTVLWEFAENTLLKGINLQDSQYYVYSAVSSEFGGFGMASFDYRGNKIWSKYIDSFPDSKTILDILHDTIRKQYIVAGVKQKIGVNTDEYYWIAGVDYRGKILWENYWRDNSKNVHFKRIFKNTLTKGYLLTTESYDFIDPELINVDSIGKLINRNPIESNICQNTSFDLLDITSFNDTSYVVTLNILRSCPNQEDGSYFYFYNSIGKLVRRLKNDWAGGYLIKDKNSRILTYGGNIIAKLNNSFALEWTKELYTQHDSESIYIKKMAKSKDGGYYGIADGFKLDRFGNNNYVVYVFKTDSLGNINQKEEYLEKLQPVMLQPNPANNQVRIAIPYYYGTVTVEFYTMLGEFLFNKTKSEQDMYDISSLSPGMYIVKAKIEETGEERTMRLVVE